MTGLTVATFQSGEEPCSCEDCSGSCGSDEIMVTAPPPSEPFQILGLDGIAAIMGALYVLLALLIG